jgi:DNA-binding transcriptional MerR regulator
VQDTKRLEQLTAKINGGKPQSAAVLLSEATHVLGVSEETLKSWERSGKLIPRRVGLRRVRVYDRQELERVAADRRALNSLGR